MTKMGNRLRNTMYDSLNYTTLEFQKDMNEIKREMPNIIDVEYEGIVD